MKLLARNIYRVGLAGCSALSGALLLLLVTLTSAHAAIHACKQADGSVVFQDSGCAVVSKPSEKKSSSIEEIPFSLDKSWFDKPPVSPDRAVCTKAGCHCGMYSRKYKNGLPLAIADALYLDGSWHRLESTLIALELPDKNVFERADLRKERDEAACNILMSQKTLRLFGTKVLTDLRQKKRYAEERGLDNPEDCDAGDTMVCTYTEMVQLYDRIQGDIKALRRNARITEEQSLLEATANDLQ